MKRAKISSVVSKRRTDRSCLRSSTALFCSTALALSVACVPGAEVDTGGTPADQQDAGLDAGWVPSAYDAAGYDAATAADDAASGAPDSAETPDAAPAVDAASSPAVDAAAPDSAEPDAAQPTSIWERCFPDIYDPAVPGPDYDQYDATYGEHCYGTNHQDIVGVERVVFIGDSVTVGSPPTESQDYYRARLADMLADHFNLEAPSALWKSSNPLTGTSTLKTSGDFASCAKWGARTDDLMQDHNQIEDCIPEEDRDKRTLIVMTAGGNDIAALTQDGVHAPYEESRAMVEEFVTIFQDAVRWIKAPGQFPNGVYVLFANMFEYTDGTADVSSCPAAAAAGFAEQWDHPEWLEEFVLYANEQYMAVAVETDSDMLMMLEQFCGHGYHNDNPDGRCYRGPGAERWFDLTCIHPNPTGHGRIADMFMAMVEE